MSTSGGLTSFSANRTCRGLQYDTPVLPKCLEPNLFADSRMPAGAYAPAYMGRTEILSPSPRTWPYSSSKPMTCEFKVNVRSEWKA